VSDLIAVAYPDKATAETVRERLAQLHVEHAIELEDAVIVDRDEKGRVSCTSCTISPRKARSAARCGVA
jgi:uncharacterized membrane protein